MGGAFRATSCRPNAPTTSAAPCVPRSDLLAACGRLDAIRLVRGRRLNYVLPTEIGEVEILAELEDHEIPRAIDDIAAHPVLGASVGPG